MNTPARKTVAKLTTLESYKLCNWLMVQSLQHGDTMDGLAARAADSLANPRINRAHIKDRMAQLGLKIPEKSMTDDEQLRKDVSFIAQFLMETLYDGKHTVPDELRWIAAR